MENFTQKIRLESVLKLIYFTIKMGLLQIMRINGGKDKCQDK